MTYLVEELLVELTIVNKNDLQDTPRLILLIDNLIHSHTHTHAHTDTQITHTYNTIINTLRGEIKG